MTMMRKKPLTFTRERFPTAPLAQGGDVAKRAFEAMLEMNKIDVAKIEAAVRGYA